TPSFHHDVLLQVVSVGTQPYPHKASGLTIERELSLHRRSTSFLSPESRYVGQLLLSLSTAQPYTRCAFAPLHSYSRHGRPRSIGTHTIRPPKPLIRWRSKSRAASWKLTGTG